ncbi:response regulator [Paenibacillus sp. Leaf72]|uniref:response regulator n=1 Tax=Paenibacillus sp. Leaf72 TaxID=1736234 RepID=UPI0006F5451F|nr:response regulator [Paenibacillus sp. Leaf72]KQO18431.1 hypothetical protein ASF12_07425 [Paenibacillus sp. Leaf72]
MKKQLYQVLIVDDEYYFRQLLIQLIDWEALGFRIKHEAENGTQALKLARQENYDLIIADINMPGMSGLDFVESLRSEYINTKIIFITSYDVFEYARAAISFGASYYLLKPIDEDELTKALAAVHDELCEENEFSRSMGELKQQLDQTKPILKDHFIRQFLLHEPTVSSETLSEQARYYGLNLAFSSYAVIIVELDELNTRFAKEQERQLWRFAVQNIVQETLGSAGVDCTFINIEKNQIAVLASLSEHSDAALFDLCEQSRIFIDQKMHLFVTFGLGQSYESISQVYLSYSEALYLLKYKFTQGGNQVIAYAQEHAGAEDAVFSLPIARSEWLTALRQKQQDTVTELIRRACDHLMESRASKEIAQFVLMECVSLGSAAILERGGSLPPDWLTERHPLFRQMHILETVAALQQWLETFFREMVFVEIEKQLPRSKNSDIVTKAVDYVIANYSNENVNLQEAARSLAVNPSYLSHIFKKEKGQSFTEYLTNIRLDKAIELLNGVSSDGLMSLKVVDVSMKVGYTDPYYFSKCFKKKFGIVPSKTIRG